MHAEESLSYGLSQLGPGLRECWAKLSDVALPWRALGPGASALPHNILGPGALGFATHQGGLAGHLLLPVQRPREAGATASGQASVPRVVNLRIECAGLAPGYQLAVALATRKSQLGVGHLLAL